MSKKEIANLACKLLAIYTIVNGLTGGLSGLASVAAILANSQGRNGPSPTEVILMSFGPYLMFIVIGIFLWSFSHRISDFIGNEKHSAKVGSSNKKAVKEVEAIAFSVLGLFFVGSALPKAVSPIISLLTLNSFTAPGLNPQILPTIGKLLEVIVHLAFGMWLLLGTHGLVNAMKKLRKAGVQQDPDS